MSLTGGALTEIDGHGGHAFVTTQDNPSPDYADGGLWLLEFAQAGDYALWVYIPATSDLSPLAVYKIAHGGASDTVQLDQAAAGGSWALLGTFSFAAGGDQWVRLGDNYDDPNTNGKRIALDALKVAPSQGCECGEVLATESQPCGESGAGIQTKTCDGCYWSAWSECSEPPSGGGGAGSGGAAGTPAGQPEGDSSVSGDALQGFVCSAGQGPSRPDWLALLGLAAAGLALGCRTRRCRRW